MLLLGRLLGSQAAWGGRGTEVRTAITSARTRRAAWSRPRSAESTAAARTWAAESAARAAGTGTRETAACRPGAEATGTRRTRRAILARTRLAHRETPALEWLLIETLDDLLGLVALEELHEGEPSRAASLTIDRHDDMGWLGDRREVRPKIRFGGGVGKVPDEQTDCQSFLVKRASRGATRK